MFKSYFKIICIITIGIFVSCENELLEGFDLSNPSSTETNGTSKTGTSSNENIEGTWKLTAWNAANPVDINNNGTASINLLDELNCYDNETIDFQVDNAGTSYADIEFDLVVGTTDEFMFTSTCIQEIENLAVTWSQTGNLVAITDVASGFTNNFTLSGNELSLLIPDGFDVSNGTGSVTVTEDLTFVYTK